MNRRRIFGIALFMVLGFFIFTFANPRNDNEGMKNEDIIKPTPTATANEEESKPEENNNQEQQNVQPVNNNQAQNNNGGGNNQVVPVVEPEPTTEPTPVPTATPVPTPTATPVPTPTATPVVPVEDEEQDIPAEDLTDYKNAAKQEIVDYRDSLDLVVVTDSIIENANNNIDEATTKEAIDKIVTDTKELLDEAKRLELVAAKEAAIKELNEYKNDYPYSDESKEARKDIIDEYTNKINDATTIEEVKNALEDGKAAIDKLVDEDFNAYKEAAKEELKNYNKDELYSEENLVKVENIKEEGLKELEEATTKEEIDEILTEKEKEIDDIQKLTETYFDVTFVDFYGNETVVPVLYNNDATAPELGNVTDETRGIVFKFNNWDKEFTNVKENITVNAIYVVDKITANIYLNDENNTNLGNVKLTVTESLSNIVKANSTSTISQVEATVVSMIAEGEKLPVSQKQNYKYTFNVLKYVEDKGFFIEANEVIDEEELARNTVVLTYKVNGDAAFVDGSKVKEVKTTTGSNTVELPTVYRNGKAVNVIWTDSNNELKEVYTKSETITATLDKTAPVIKLNGEVSREVTESKDVKTYVEEGFTVTDNYTELTNNDVVVTITKDGNKVDSVSLNVPGTYVINYTVEDTEGNIGRATRTIVVVPAKLNNIQVTQGHGKYFVGDLFNKNDVTVTAHYNNGKKVVITDYEVKGFNTDEPTKNSVKATIEYQGKTANYTYKVYAIEVERISLSKTSGEYFVGDKEMEKVVVTAYYNNGTSKEGVTGYTVSGFNTNYATTNGKAVFTFGGKTANYNYIVKEVKVEGITLSSYSKTYTYDTAMENVIVTAHYNNGKTETLNKQVCTGWGWNKKCTDGYTVDSEFYPTWEGTHAIKYTYNGFTGYNGTEAKYTYTIKPLELLSISLSETTGKYYVGDSMNDITVTAHYDNNKYDEELCEYDWWYCPNGYEVSGFNTNVETSNGKATFTFGGKSAEYNYTVVKAVPELTITNVKTNYLAGEYPQYTATLTYKGKTYDVTNSYYLNDDISTSLSNVGLGKTATITYNDYNGIKATATFTYDVRPNATLYANGNKYYFEFELPRNGSVTAIKTNNEVINIEKIKNGKYYISEADWTKLQVMKNENSGRTLEITYKVGNEFTAIYTKLVTR